jgi:hypothetical protein
MREPTAREYMNFPAAGKPVKIIQRSDIYLKFQQKNNRLFFNPDRPAQNMTETAPESVF